MLQCYNCKRFYKDSYKLRRHYLIYLPYYFGKYICVICERNFETELKLLKHILARKREVKDDGNFNVKAKRELFFEKSENKFFGSKSSEFTSKDIKYFINQKCVSNYDVKGSVDKVIDLTHDVNMDYNSRIVPSDLYDNLGTSDPQTSSLGTH